MHILCTICSDLVNQAESIYVTKCGHLFHHQCLAQWIERSKSCPQCRNKVTEKCMFRIYPTISNDNCGEDVTKVQSRLDDAQLQLRQYKASCNTYEAKLAELTANLKSNGEMLRKTEKSLISKEAAISALKQQREFDKIKLTHIDKLEKENEELKKNMETLNGLQKVLNATSNDVEEMLKDYGDLRTIATFAGALKRALLESESRKAESRTRLQLATRQLAEQAAELRVREKKLLYYERKLEILKKKRKAAEGDDEGGGEEGGAGGGGGKRARSGGAGGGGGECARSGEAGSGGGEREQSGEARSGAREVDVSFESQVQRIQQAESPYLRLRRGALAGPALLPSEYALLKHKGAPPAGKSAKGSPPRNQHSIFYKKPPLGAGAGGGGGGVYDGLGGRARPDLLPAPGAPRHCPPRLSARRRLRPPAPRPSQDIALMLQNTPTKPSPGTS